jgi:uncharacterized protein YaaR (DUF327 family)
MLTYESHFEEMLKRLIDEEIDRLKENLTNSITIPDLAHYKEIVGQIAGLRKAIDLCDEANKLAQEH